MKLPVQRPDRTDFIGDKQKTGQLKSKSTEIRIHIQMLIIISHCWRTDDKIKIVIDIYDYHMGMGLITELEIRPVNVLQTWHVFGSNHEIINSQLFIFRGSDNI